MEKITHKSEYQAGLVRMEELLLLVGNDTSPESKSFQELDQLSDQVAAYEEETYSFEANTLKEMIELRMFQRKLRQKDVAELLGTTPSRISEILHGKRKLTFDRAKGLYRKLNIDPELILNS